MEEVDGRERIQKEAFNNWTAFNCIGTVLMPTGTGKSFVAIKAIEHIKNISSEPIKVLHLSERTNREAGFEKQIEIYNKLYNTFIKNGIELYYYRYQGFFSIPDITFDLVICDEIHESLSPMHFELYYRIKRKALIGLTALIPYVKYTLPDNSTISKWELLKLQAPVCYNCSVKTAQLYNSTRINNLFFIRCSMNIKEQDAYNKLSSEIAIYRDSFKGKTLGNKRLLLLNRTVQKLNIAMQLIEMNSRHKLPSILFNTDLEMLKILLPDSYISGKNKKEYKNILNKFNKEIYTIGSFKMLKQGENIDNLINCIILSSNTSNLKLDTIQRTGRLRKDGNLNGNIIVLINDNTTEFDFIKKMSDILNISDYFVFDNFTDFYDKYKTLNNI